MTRTISFPALLATIVVTGAAAIPAYADTVSENPAQAWITRIEDPAFSPAHPSGVTVTGDPAQAFLARFAAPSYSPAQAKPVVVVSDSHPDRDFIARLSTGDAPIREATVTTTVQQTASRSVALLPGGDSKRTGH